MSDSLVQGAFSSGKLEKAKLVVISDHHSGKLAGTHTLELPINPNKVTISKEVNRKSDSPVVGNDTEQRQETGSPPKKITLHVIFDTYEERKDVRQEYINTLELFSSVEPDLHHRPTLHLVWGKFESDFAMQLLNVEIEKFDVTYTMFLKDATPVRCRTTIVLKEVTDPKERGERNSPDHAKLHTVQRGDTLHSISHREYDDPKEWRRIADANSIDDPMQLSPGTKLLIPPILK